MKISRISLIFIWIIYALSINAGPTSSYEFLKTSFGAENTAIGGAGIAGLRQPGAIIVNPSCISGIQNRTATFSYLDYFADIQGGQISYHQPLDETRAYAVSLAYMSYGSIDETDITGARTGSFTPMDFYLSATYAAQSVSGIGYGVTMKYIRSQIQNYSSDAVAADAGLFYGFDEKMINLGLSVTNLGMALNAYDETRENLPTAVQAGFSKTLAHLPLTLHFKLLRYQYQKSDAVIGLYWALGGEFKLSEVAFLRWGYHSVGQEQKAESDKDRFTGLSLGFGTRIKQFRIDYALSLHGVLGNINQFTVSMIL